MELLRPTVKRDLSLFSVLAWESGYLTHLKNSLNWSYPIIFHYDKSRVNFYHRMSDFQYFKQVVTPKLIQDTDLFRRCNQEFKVNIARLRGLQKKLKENDLPEVFSLIGKVMAFYIFIVSDSFIEARPEAWESRHLSEGILYELDEQIEDLMAQGLGSVGKDRSLAHFVTLDEFLSRTTLSEAAIVPREQGYIIYKQEIITNKSFPDICVQHKLENPENITENSPLPQQITGNCAYKGTAQGNVVIVRNRRDINKVQEANVLVTIMTNVNYLPAIKKAAAIITDEGGVTCHAAIMARELKKPCVIGTKIATKILNDGDRVEVDANAGTVTRLNNE